MAIQILPAAPQKRSFAQKLNEGVGRGLEMGSQLIQQHQAKQKQEQQIKQMDETIYKLTGQNVSGLPVDAKTKFLQEVTKGEYSLEGRKLGTQGKSPAGGLTGQPVPPEVSQKLNEIVRGAPNSSADELKGMMDEQGIPPAYSNGYVENRRRQDERIAASKDKRSEAGQKRAEKILDEGDILGKELPLLESSVMAMEDAIQNGDQSFWSLDNLAELTGSELFRTAKGGQFKTAAKTYFLNDLKSSGGRPNMFIEKMLADALPKMGRSEEANQTVLESFKFSNDLKKKRHETIRDLEKYYEESMGFLPGRFNSIVEENMKPYIEERQKDYEKRLKEIAVIEKKKSKKGKEKKSQLSGTFIDVMGPDGQMYEIDQSEVDQLPEGYKIQ